VKAVILAAGRGSRLGNMTADQPKCMVELQGRPLLHWQLASLKSAGIKETLVVTGYQQDKLPVPDRQKRYNPDWSTTNMVASLLAASNDISESGIVSYSDIIYSPHTISALMKAEGELSIAIDRGWEKLWRLRFENPLDDAESLVLGSENEVLEIGQKVSDISKVEGQYMGLLKIGPQAIDWIMKLCLDDRELLRKLDMTSLLSLWLQDGKRIQTVENNEAWCEIDSVSDLEVARKMLTDGHFDTSFFEAD
jgi:L-glutamine-phosphate cytidylyltransferase